MTFKGGERVFKKGDTVIYGTGGVCRVDGIEQLAITGEKKDYYVLRPVFNSRSTHFVPLDSPVLMARMHSLLTPEGISELAAKFDSVEPEWIENEFERKARYNAVLAENDREAAMALIKAARIHRENQARIGKKLHVLDERFIKDAKKQLREEASFVLNTAIDDVLPFLDEEALAI